MTQESALWAPGERHAGSPTGFRRLTPGLLKVDRTAESFSGLPNGVTMHGQLLAAFKGAAPSLGLSPRLVHAIDWLFRFTMPQDWGRGGRPIVWPSASTEQEALGLSPTRTKAINRALIEAGRVVGSPPNGATLAGPISAANRFPLINRSWKLPFSSKTSTNPIPAVALIWADLPVGA